jgi:hypothetical protein
LGHLSGIKSLELNEKENILATGAKVFKLYRMDQEEFGIPKIMNLLKV